MSTIIKTDIKSADKANKPKWNAPRVSRMSAGSAENGPNPNAPDGQFSFGS